MKTYKSTQIGTATTSNTFFKLLSSCLLIFALMFVANTTVLGVTYRQLQTQIYDDYAQIPAAQEQSVIKDFLSIRKSIIGSKNTSPQEKTELIERLAEKTPGGQTPEGIKLSKDIKRAVTLSMTNELISNGVTSNKTKLISLLKEPAFTLKDVVRIDSFVREYPAVLQSMDAEEMTALSLKHLIKTSGHTINNTETAVRSYLAGYETQETRGDTFQSTQRINRADYGGEFIKVLKLVTDTSGLTNAQKSKMLTEMLSYTPDNFKLRVEKAMKKFITEKMKREGKTESEISAVESKTLTDLVGLAVGKVPDQAAPTTQDHNLNTILDILITKGTKGTKVDDYIEAREQLEKIDPETLNEIVKALPDSVADQKTFLDSLSAPKSVHTHDRLVSGGLASPQIAIVNEAERLQGGIAHAKTTDKYETIMLAEKINVYWERNSLGAKPNSEEKTALDTLKEQIHVRLEKVKSKYDISRIDNALFGEGGILADKSPLTKAFSGKKQGRKWYKDITNQIESDNASFEKAIGSDDARFGDFKPGSGQLSGSNPKHVETMGQSPKDAATATETARTFITVAATTSTTTTEKNPTPAEEFRVRSNAFSGRTVAATGDGVNVAVTGGTASGADTTGSDDRSDRSTTRAPTTAGNRAAGTDEVHGD